MSRTPRLSRRPIIGMALLAAALSFTTLTAGNAYADEDSGTATWYLDENGNAVEDNPGWDETERPVVESVEPNSAIVGKWYNENGVILRFDAQNGYIDNGQLGACIWPNNNRYFTNLQPLSGSNVFSAGGVSSWEEDYYAGGRATCLGIRNVKFGAGAILTVNGNSLRITGSSGASGAYTKVFTCTSIAYGDKISLKAADGGGGYVQAVNGGGANLLANTGAVGEYETFTLVSAIDSPYGQGVSSRSSVNLQASNGQWVQAEWGGSGSLGQGELLANTNARGSYERFTLTRTAGDGQLCSGDAVNFSISATDRVQFVQAENGGGGRLLANTSAAGAYETFRIEKR